MPPKKPSHRTSGSSTRVTAIILFLGVGLIFAWSIGGIVSESSPLTTDRETTTAVVDKSSHNAVMTVDSAQSVVNDTGNQKLVTLTNNKDTSVSTTVHLEHPITGEYVEFSSMTGVSVSNDGLTASTTISSGGTETFYVDVDKYADDNRTAVPFTIDGSETNDELTFTTGPHDGPDVIDG